MKLRNLTIDTEKCIRCNRCVKLCPCFSLEPGPGGVPRWRDGGEERCFECQHCLAVCPAGALSICGCHPDNSAPAGEGPNPERMLNLIQNRRSVRAYKAENLPAATLEKLKYATAWPPTGVNFHRLDFAFVDDIDVMHSIRNGIYQTINAMLDHDELPESLEGMRHYFELARKSGADVIFRGAPHFVVVSYHQMAPCGIIDPVIALSYFEMYAQSLGVGTVWGGIITALVKSLPDFRLRLGISKNYEPGYAMIFGPPAVHFARATQPGPMKLRQVR